jgi:hypothetical protein
MMVAEKKEWLFSKEELCDQKGKKIFLFGKRKKVKTWTQKKKNQSPHQFFFFQ